MNEKINVLYLINYAGNGGSEMYLKILADNMKDNVNPILVYNEEGLLVHEFEEKNIKCIKLEMKSPFDFKAAKELSKIVKENNVQIIHSNYLRENYISILSKLFGMKAKIVYTCHFNTYDSKIITLCNKFFYRKLSKIISISNEVTKSLIASGSNKNKIELIYHGVKENDLVAPSNDSKLKFGVNTNLVVVSSASRFSREKGNSFFIKSTSKLVERYENEHKDINFKILLANEGPLLEDCKTLVEILNLNDVVTFVGYQKDMKDFYMASDIYVTSSQSEGLGLATIESLNYGIPNIVTNIGGLTEIINEETNCGLTVPYNDEYEFANKLYTLINDNALRNKFKINAKEVIKNNFSINKMIEKTLNVYNEILKQK